MDKLLITLLNILFPRYSELDNDINHYIPYFLTKDTKFYNKKLKLKNCYIDKVVYFYKYKITSYQQLIHRIKFNKEFDIISNLTLIIDKYLQTINLQNLIVVPVSYSPDRFIHRGFDISHSICKYLSKNYLVADIFVRTNTKEQNRLSRQLRLNNLKNTIQIKDGVAEYLIKNNIKKVIIIDDVVTTGTTLNSHAKALKKINQSLIVEGLCIAGGNI